MVTHSSILAQEIPWTEEPGGLQSMGSQRVGHNLVAKQQEVVLNCLATFFFSIKKSKLALLIDSRMRQHPIQEAERHSEVLLKMMVGIYRQKTAWVTKVVSKRKERIASVQLIFCGDWGAGGREWQEVYYFLTRIRKCQWFKIPLLGEVETEVRLGIKFRWGLPQMAPF